MHTVIDPEMLNFLKKFQQGFPLVSTRFVLHLVSTRCSYDFRKTSNPTIIVDSHTGAPIALDADDLGLGLTQIVIPLQVAGEPNNILRPGVTGSVVIYTFTSAGIGITIGSPNF